jgi:hypothetical protein
MWHHVTNHLIISNDKDFISEMNKTMCLSHLLHTDSVCSAIPAPLSSWLAARCLGLVPISCASAVMTGGRSVSGLPTVMTKCTSISCAWWPTLCHPQSLVLVTFNAHQVLLVPLPMQSQVLCISHIHLLLANAGTPLGTGGLIPPALPTICLCVTSQQGRSPDVGLV